MIPEFIGRLPILATLEDLDERALIEILTRPKNALAKQYQRMFEMEGVKLRFHEDALSAISRRAIGRKTGARGLRSILEGILLETMFELPGLNGEHLYGYLVVFNTRARSGAIMQTRGALIRDGRVIHALGFDR